MQIAIHTASLNPDTPTALERAADLGFKTVELAIQNGETGYGNGRGLNRRFYRRLHEQLAEASLSVWSVTTPILAQEQNSFGQAHSDILLGGAVVAGIVGAHVYVARPADLFTGEIDFERYLENRTAPPVVAGFDEIWAQTVNRRITLAVLNQGHTSGAPLTNRPERLHRVTEDLAIGWALDVQRARHEDKIEAWLAAAGERLVVAHLYDLDGGGRCAPYSDIWQAWLPALQRTRLRSVVLYANPAQSDGEITASRHYIQELVEVQSGQG